jgi:hypothetical protein
MKKRPSTFCVTLALMTFATLFSALRSEPANPNTLSSDAAVSPAQPPLATEPAAAPSANTTGIKKAAQPAKLSFGVDEVVKMHQGGVEAGVILNYIENSSVPYHLSAEEVVRLRDIGVPSQVITTMIRHGAKVQQQQNAATAVIQQKATEEARAASANFNPYSAPDYSQPAPVVNYTYAYPTYVNAYPAYVYPRYYPSYYSYYSYPRYCYSSPYYYRYGYPGYRYCYPYGGYGHYRGYGHYPHYAVGATFGHSPRVSARVRY